MTISQFNRSPLHSGVFAIAISAVALLLTLVLRPFLDPSFWVLFAAAAWISAWLYGRTGGLICTAASAVEILYFFLRPEPATIPSWNIILRLTAFVLMGSLITW